MKDTLKPEDIADPQLAQLWRLTLPLIRQVELLHDDINQDDAPAAIANRMFTRLHLLQPRLDGLLADIAALIMAPLNMPPDEPA